MIDPLDDPEREARRLQVRSWLVDIAPWLPYFFEILPDYLPIGVFSVIGALLIAYIKFDLIGGISGLWIGNILNALLIYISLNLIFRVRERNRRKDR